MSKKLNGFNNGRDASEGVGGKESPEGAYIAGIDPYDTVGKFLIMDESIINSLKDGDKKKMYETANKLGLIAIHPPKLSLKEAIEVLCNALREDKSEGSYYHSWMCNIKMSIFDNVKNCTVNDFETGTDEKELLGALEEGAKNFLDLLIKE